MGDFLAFRKMIACSIPCERSSGTPREAEDAESRVSPMLAAPYRRTYIWR
jgi:hypothetical protein